MTGAVALIFGGLQPPLGIVEAEVRSIRSSSATRCGGCPDETAWERCGAYLVKAL